tara:strand:+ start:930 stop:1478 length:549 start_codon:yes stop_codon:yes gene_type:complete
MSNADDLLDPLRFNPLGNYNLFDIRNIGDGVFTQVDTLESLELLDKIIKAYRSVHIPSYGQLIAGGKFSTNPQDNQPTFWEGGNVTSASQESLTALNVGEVVRYQAIGAKSTESGTTCVVSIYHPIYNKETVVASQELTTSSIEQNIVTDLEISYPQQIRIAFDSSGTVDATFSASSCKTQF